MKIAQNTEEEKCASVVCCVKKLRCKQQTGHVIRVPLPVMMLSLNIQIVDHLFLRHYSWGEFVATFQENRDKRLEYLRLKYLLKEVIVRHKKTLLQHLLVTLSANYCKLWIALRLFARLIMGMFLFAITVKLF